MPCYIAERIYAGKFGDTEDSALNRLILTMPAAPLNGTTIYVHMAHGILVPITHCLLDAAWGSAIT